MSGDRYLEYAIDRQRLLRNLEQLLLAHAPSGNEAEVDRLVVDFVGGSDAYALQPPVAHLDYQTA